MNLLEQFKNLRNQLGKTKENAINIPNDDKIGLLSALYTYNHGNKVCKPFEYSCKDGRKENDGGDYLKFKQDILKLGYKVEDIIFVENNYKLRSDAEDFEKRKSNNSFFPSDVKYFILSNENGIKFPFIETPETLEFLAKSGDKRAIGTYENWLKRLYEINSPTHNAINDRKK